MKLLRAVDVERIYRETDELELNRDWVVVPLNCAEAGMETERALPDGRILIRPPDGGAFEPWLRDLRNRLTSLGLSRTPRRSVADPSRHLTGRDDPRTSGTRSYVNRPPDLNVLETGAVENENTTSLEGPGAAKSI